MMVQQVTKMISILEQQLEHLQLLQQIQQMLKLKLMIKIIPEDRLDLVHLKLH